jgi:hypothetical protein
VVVGLFQQVSAEVIHVDVVVRAIQQWHQYHNDVLQMLVELPILVDQ